MKKEANENKRIESVAIAGGGTAGWLWSVTAGCNAVTNHSLS